MTALPILYSFRRCPYAMRARLALHSAGQAVELREVVLRDKPQAMLDASPKATVPVLVLACGTVIDESRDIGEWALSTADPEGWLGHDRAQMDELIATNDGPFKQALDRYKYPDRFDDVARDDEREKAAVILRSLDGRLASGEWLLGARPSWADFAIAPFVRQFAHVDFDWFCAQDWHHLAGWLERFKSSDRFDAIMVKHPAWTPGDPPVIFARNETQSDIGPSR
jgi:glutathione S-transferase